MESKYVIFSINENWQEVMLGVCISLLILLPQEKALYLYWHRIKHNNNLELMFIGLFYLFL